MGGWSDLINGVEEIWVGEPFNLAWGSPLLGGRGTDSELHEAEGCMERFAAFPKPLN